MFLGCSYINSIYRTVRLLLCRSITKRLSNSYGSLCFWETGERFREKPLDDHTQCVSVQDLCLSLSLLFVQDLTHVEAHFHQ